MKLIFCTVHDVVSEINRAGNQAEAKSDGQYGHPSLNFQRGPVKEKGGEAESTLDPVLRTQGHQPLPDCGSDHIHCRFL